MEITLYNNTSENNKIGKILTNSYTIEGTLREQTSLIAPAFNITGIDPREYNYCYIPEFKRYYFIRQIDSARNNVWRINCSVDVLESFKEEILNLTAIVEKQQVIGNQFKDDGSIVMENRSFNTIYNFTNGFNDNGELILITAGANYVFS